MCASWARIIYGYHYYPSLLMRYQPLLSVTFSDSSVSWIIIIQCWPWAIMHHELNQYWGPPITPVASPVSVIAANDCLWNAGPTAIIMKEELWGNLFPIKSTIIKHLKWTVNQPSWSLIKHPLTIDWPPAISNQLSHQQWRVGSP